MNSRRIFYLMMLPLVLLGTSSCGYNKMVGLEENVAKNWSNVEGQYQRRADLVQNLVNTVKGAANFEQETLERVVQARSQATSMNIKADELTPENIQKFQEAQSQLSGALSRLLVTVERYPELKATDAFRDLMVQLEGTENRIATERRKYNEAVDEYNSYVRKIPQNITASLFGFEKKGYFEADKGAEKVPEVEF